uniref:Uncharacterized protein n=1 Tax=Rhizophora mucronata TaxID=61149 RepID=A0A2P2L222_RHIMU
MKLGYKEKKPAPCQGPFTRFAMPFVYGHQSPYIYNYLFIYIYISE